MADILIAIVGFSLIVVIGYYFHYFNELKELMKAKYTEDYEGTEKPTFFLNSTPRNNFLFLKYLLTREYKKHNDEQLTETCEAVLAYLVLAYFWVFALASMFVLRALGYIG